MSPYTLYVFVLCVMTMHCSDAFKYIHFDMAMGKNGPLVLAYDRQFYGRLGMDVDQTYAYFRQQYEAYSPLRVSASERVRIPKIIHQIWIGDKVPEKFATFQHTWKKLHPEWEYRLWTQHDLASLHLVNHDLIAQSRNPGEISDIMRYEILYRFGGVYVDMDFECIAPLDELNYCYDFYIGLQPLDSGLVQLGIGLIGACPHHPILAYAITNLKASYDDPEHVHNAPARTGPAYFTSVFISAAHQHGMIDVALPAFYFYPLACQAHKLLYATWKEEGAFGIHHWAKSWLLPQFRREEFKQLT